MAKSIVIEAKNVHKTFQMGRQSLEILKGIDFKVHSGEYVIFFGPSGCGKSTTLNVVCGLEPPTEGELLVRGESLYKKNQHEITEYRRSKIGIVFQQFNLLKSLTIQENVALPLAAGGEKYKKRMDRSAHLLDMVGLSKYLTHKPTELSGGQQQRVAIARSLAVNPWIIICDEPTGNLDTHAADEIMQIIARLNSKSKRTVILVTHNQEYLMYPHRVIFFRDGMIMKEQVNRSVSETVKETSDSLDLDLKDIVDTKKGTKKVKDEAKKENIEEQAKDGDSQL